MLRTENSAMLNTMGNWNKENLWKSLPIANQILIRNYFKKKKDV